MAAGGADFATAARPLWFMSAGLGLVILALGLFATSPRGLRSAERLAPLIAGPPEPVKEARV